MRCFLPVVSVPVLGAAFALAACGLPNERTSVEPHLAEPALPPTVHVRQFGFGSEARFARCTDRDCPGPTPKLLAPAISAVRVSAARIEPALAAPNALPADDPSSAPQHRATPPINEATEVRKVALHFAVNSAQLTAAHKVLLSDAIGGLRRADRIVIVGRTDSVGSDGLNQSLALARGLTVRDHLLDLAPDLPARISIDAKGRCCYAAANDSSQGRARNRRVELIYSPRDEAAL